MEQGVQEKWDLLKARLAGYDRLGVAFSGGVDSTLLLLGAHEVLGKKVLALTVSGPNFPPSELKDAQKFCDKHHISHLVINMPDEVFDSFAHNPPDRCYLCKRAEFSHMMECAGDMPLADGSNVDDADDYRPGRRALKELGILSPLAEVGLTKGEIRTILRALNDPVWNKPAYACLASRIPYGEQLTPEKLRTVYEIEEFIHSLGFPQVRVRHHGKIAIVEVPPEERHKFANPSILDAVNAKIKDAGFLYATMDLGGYHTGNLNQEIQKE